VGADVTWVCDVDSRAVEKTVAAVRARQQHGPSGITDFRRALDDPALDALIIAAPDH